MKTRKHRHNNESGSVLVSTTVYSGILLVTLTALLSLASNRTLSTQRRINWNEAYYHAENSIFWAMQKIADAEEGGDEADFLGSYSTAAGSLDLGYLQALATTSSTFFEGATVEIENHPNAVDDLYEVTASSTVGGKTRTLQATIRKNAPSLVFDYEYFLNNWGWWWGSSITGWGGNRSNWDFDFKYSPTVNGDILANGQVESNEVAIDPLGDPSSIPLNGLAKNNPLEHIHSGAPYIEMPNLKDFSYYEAKAINEGGSVVVNGSTIVSAVHSAAGQTGLYLEGTSTHPIEIDGPVVIPGDLVIKGEVTGQGTFYVGGNLYVIDNLTYANGPDFSTAPETMSPTARDEWVQDSLDTGSDLVAYAVRESIFVGSPNGSHWKSRVYNPSSYGLKNVGGENTLGEDGIKGTPDDGVPYLDTNDDGTPDSAWYDADGDGIVDSNYNYDTDIKMTTSRANAITNYPTDSYGNPEDFTTVATDYMNTLEGVFYTNHAAGMRLRSSHMVLNGTIVSRDEAIIFSSTAKLKYDSRIHSRYSDDPNRFIDLGLPIANKTRIENLIEIVTTEATGTPTT